MKLISILALTLLTTNLCLSSEKTKGGVFFIIPYIGPANLQEPVLGEFRKDLLKISADLKTSPQSCLRKTAVEIQIELTNGLSQNEYEGSGGRTRFFSNNVSGPVKSTTAHLFARGNTFAGVANALRHEVSHLVLHCRLNGAAPRWFDEALAIHYEAKEAQNIILGHSYSEKRLGVSELLAATSYPQNLGAFYGQAYFLFFLLFEKIPLTKFREDYLVSFIEKAKQVGWESALNNFFPVFSNIDGLDKYFSTRWSEEEGDDLELFPISAQNMQIKSYIRRKT